MQDLDDKPINRTNWITKKIRKGNTTHIIAFCPACTTGDPWIIHESEGYTLLRVDPANEELLTQQKKHRTSEEWPKRPKKVPYYKDKWSLGDLYDKPLDWNEQSCEYDRKTDSYESDKAKYDTFCKKKLEEVREAEELTLRLEEKHEELKKRKADDEQRMKEDKFMAFASERHPNHPAYADYIREQNLKKQKMNERSTFNSPTPRNKENFESLETQNSKHKM